MASLTPGKKRDRKRRRRAEVERWAELGRWTMEIDQGPPAFLRDLAGRVVGGVSCSSFQITFRRRAA